MINEKRGHFILEFGAPKTKLLGGNLLAMGANNNGFSKRVLGPGSVLIPWV